MLGFADDVHVAAQFDVSAAVPSFQHGAYTTYAPA
jgi:phosphosulfolactate phosphohydrolase-like enzyme